MNNQNICIQDDDLVIKDYESLAKRLLGCMHYGIRIETFSGHRYIIVDLEADNCPRALINKWSVLEDGNSNFDTEYQEKHYGSVISALNLIDSWLIDGGEETTLLAYDYYIMTDIDGEGTNCEKRVFGLNETV